MSCLSDPHAFLQSPHDDIRPASQPAMSRSSTYIRSKTFSFCQSKLFQQTNTLQSDAVKPIYCFFLHGSRRYVCRGCTSHLKLVKRELRTKLQDNKPPKQKQNTQIRNKQHPKPSTRFVPRSATSAKLRRVKRGAMIQSLHSVLIAIRNGSSAQSKSFVSLERGLL